MAAFIRGQRLHIINCNQHTEAADFLGGYRPNRRRSAALAKLRDGLASFNLLAGAVGLEEIVLPMEESSDSVLDAATEAQQVIASAASKLPAEHAKQLRELAQSLSASAGTVRAPFEWADGPLVQAMRQGDMLLIDEINLADDAVLERLNR